MLTNVNQSTGFLQCLIPLVIPQDATVALTFPGKSKLYSYIASINLDVSEQCRYLLATHKYISQCMCWQMHQPDEQRIILKFLKLASSFILALLHWDAETYSLSQVSPRVFYFVREIIFSVTLKSRPLKYISSFLLTCLIYTHMWLILLK